MRDNLGDPGVDADPAGYQTRVPVATWDPVPGASSYEVQVASWTGSACSWATSTYLTKTSVPSWSPLGSTGANPVIWQGTLAEDVPIIAPGTHCFRVRARSDRAPVLEEVYGDYTYLQDGTTGSAAPVGPAFTWTDYPDPALAGPCRRREPDRPDLVADGNLPEEARRARSQSNPVSSEMLPVWAWSPIQGASSYDISIDSPDGTHRDFTGFRTPATSFLKMTGTGVFHWRVKANFPKALTGEIPGPYSATQSFTRTIGEPGNARTDSARDHVLLSWDPRLGAKN